MHCSEGEHNSFFYTISYRCIVQKENIIPFLHYFLQMHCSEGEHNSFLYTISYRCIVQKENNSFFYTISYRCIVQKENIIPFLHYFLQMHCSEGEHNSFSTLFLTTPEGCLKALLHDPYGKLMLHDVYPCTVKFLNFQMPEKTLPSST